MKKSSLLKSLLVVAILVFSALSSAQAMDVTLACDPNSEADLAGYKIYWSQTSGQFTAANMREFPLSSITPTAPQFVITGLSETVTWYFVAAAYDTENRESGYSNQASTPPWDGVTGIPPAPPGGLKPMKINIVRIDGTTVEILIP